MIKWTKKKYAIELKKGYWDLEPHFHYYSQIKLYGLFGTILKGNMTPEHFKSAMYGEFVKEGKPILKGFYSNMNLISKIIDKIIKRSLKEQEVKVRVSK